MSVLQGASEISDFFRTNQVPLHYVSTSVFNLVGINQLVERLSFVNTIDSFDGRSPNVFVPPREHEQRPQSIEAASAFLLSHPAVAARLRASGGGVLFLMFDERAEALAHDLGLTLALPSAALRQRLDSKLATTRLADRAGIPSVPNVLARVDSYRALREVAHGLGDDLVVQLPYGDSGTTTFFISSEADFQAHAHEIAAQPTVKVMRRIACREAAIEGCVTRSGTLAGPLMTELVGFPELTPYPGGWCGNEVFGADASPAMTPDIRQQALRATVAIGEQLRAEGYWGVFGLDFLIDQDTGALYLGELNPRITGTTPLTTQAALDRSEVPLLLVHLLEWLGVAYALDIAQVNQRWAEAATTPSWSQLIIEHVAEAPDLIAHAPRTGIWRMQPGGALTYARPAFEPHGVAGEDEGFVFRTIDAGDMAVAGRSICRLMVRGRLLDDNHRLTTRASAWIDGCRMLFSAPGAE